MQIPILRGIYTDTVSDFRTSYPVNMVPVPKETGISAGYLRPAEGAVKLGDGTGKPRGAINWNGMVYAVLGENLVRVNADWTLTTLGFVGDDGTNVTFTYSFEQLAVTSAGGLYYWDGATLTKVTDGDLGIALSVVWVDGYFMTTDGEFLVVTDLGNPLSINPLHYGSAEIDPDPVVAVIKMRNEAHAIGRHTVEVFENIGGTGFPFQRIKGAQIQKGAIGSNAVCLIDESIAFLGGGRNEPPAVYLGANATAMKISTKEIEDLLLNYTEAELSQAHLCSRMHEAHEDLWIHLTDRTLVYDLAASAALGEPVWYQLTTAQDGFSEYIISCPIWCYDKWIVFDVNTGDYGYLTKETSRQFGNIARWEFGTAIIYNESRGALFNSIELVCLNGRAEAGDEPYIATSYSIDGLNWSMERPIRLGYVGERMRRLVWLQQGRMTNWRVQRFRGDSRTMVTSARIEAALEPLAI